MTPEMRELERELFYALDGEFLAMGIYDEIVELTKYSFLGKELLDKINESNFVQNESERVYDAVVAIEDELEREYDDANPPPPPKTCEKCGKPL